VISIILKGIVFKTLDRSTLRVKGVKQLMKRWKSSRAIGLESAHSIEMGRRKKGDLRIFESSSAILDEIDGDVVVVVGSTWRDYSAF
jgi:hypothetical protein